MSDSQKKAQVVEEEFQVETILDRRTKGGVTEYFLKWRGYDESENTWEPVANLDCPDLIAAFEADRKKQADSKKRRQSQPTTTPVEKKAKIEEVTKNEVNTKRGFERRLQPEKILGATDASGQLMFLIKWKDSDEADLVPSLDANTRCPQLVIKFYEDRLTWNDSL
ncbi:Chromobox -like protein 3 [Halotydeus destructor]|nr:Chromobox -like protein 3 [Halotydeus destructor]